MHIYIYIRVYIRIYNVNKFRWRIDVLGDKFCPSSVVAT